MASSFEEVSGFDPFSGSGELRATMNSPDQDSLIRALNVVPEMEYPHWMMVAGACLVVASFLGLWISRYKNREPAEDNQHSAAPPDSSVVGMAEEAEEMSARHSSAKQWKQADDDQLKDMATSGTGPFEIARLLHRSPSAIRKRASLLGITVQGW